MIIKQPFKFVSGTLFLPLVACAGPELEPAATAIQPRGMEEAVMADEQGVKVIAQADAWTGKANIDAEVTPLRVIVQNQSTQPIQIRYDAFTLKAPDGTIYHAIPPRRVEGVAETNVAPGFGYEGFYAAPYYGGYYSGIARYEGPFAYDPLYYDNHYNYWEATTQLPTLEMLTRALPEGVLEANGRLDGFVYFEHVQKKEGTPITLHVDLKGAENEQPFVSLQMPFVLD